MAKKSAFIKTDKTHSVFSMEADKDYIIARLLNFTGAAFASRAGYYSQQALEKYLKAFLVQQSGKYLKEHDLLKLAKYCSKLDTDFSDKNFIKNLEVFNLFIDVGRYGGEASYNPLSKRTKEFQTAGIMVWLDSNIKILDSLVFKIRSKLDFKKVGFSDNLKAILENDISNYFVGTWRLPIKLKGMFTTGNDYFQ